MAVDEGVAGPLTEPTLAPGRFKRPLFGGQLLRRRQYSGGRGRSAEEVGLDPPDRTTTELDVAGAVPLKSRRTGTAAKAGGDVIGHDPRRRLGEYPGLGAVRT